MTDEQIEQLSGYEQIAKQIVDSFKGKAKAYSFVHPDLGAQRQITRLVERGFREQNKRVALYLDEDAGELVLAPVK